MRLDDRTVLTASRHGTVYRIDAECGRHTRVAELDMLAFGCELDMLARGIAPTSSNTAAGRGHSSRSW
jgi:hypothetical protein